MLYLVLRKQKLSWSLLSVSVPDHLGSDLIIDAGRPLTLSPSFSSPTALRPPQPSPRLHPQGHPSQDPLQPKQPPKARPPEVNGPSSPCCPSLGMGWAALTDAPMPTAQQQLAFLEGRKKQLLQAALRAKQKNDVEGAKMHLRQAKGLDPMLEASRNGLPVDITKVKPLGLLNLSRCSPVGP